MSCRFMNFRHEMFKYQVIQLTADKNDAGNMNSSGYGDTISLKSNCLKIRRLLSYIHGRVE